MADAASVRILYINRPRAIQGKVAMRKVARTKPTRVPAASHAIDCRGVVFLTRSLRDLINRTLDRQYPSIQIGIMWLLGSYKLSTASEICICPFAIA